MGQRRNTLGRPTSSPALRSERGAVSGPVRSLNFERQCTPAESFYGSR